MSLAAPGRRPTIRLRPASPPRETDETREPTEHSVVTRTEHSVVTYKLPPPRTPPRRVLQIVTDDDANEALAQAASAPSPSPSVPEGAPRSWRAGFVLARPHAVLVAIAALGLALGATLAFASRARSSADAAALEAARAALVASPPPVVAPPTKAAKPTEPAIPSFDVKSLPPAKR